MNESQPRTQTPYNTGKIKIGCHYQRPVQVNTTKEDALWMGVLSKQRKEFGVDEFEQIGNDLIRSIVIAAIIVMGLLLLWGM